MATLDLKAMMSSNETLGRSSAGEVRKRLLADYLNIWEEIFETRVFCDWAYDRRVSKLYIHGAPQCGKVSLCH